MAAGPGLVSEGGPETKGGGGSEGAGVPDDGPMRTVAMTVDSPEIASSKVTSTRRNPGVEGCATQRIGPAA